MKLHSLLNQANRSKPLDKVGQAEMKKSPLIRTVPSAVTPISPQDLLTGVYQQCRSQGRMQFRTEILRYLNGRSAATYTSFRRALAACLLTLRAESGAKTVLIPSFCSSDYPKAIDGTGLRYRRYDVSPRSLAAELDSLRAQSFDDVLAVIAVNVLGYTSDMDHLRTLCDEHDVFLVEALGYGLGTEYKRRRLGQFGDCSILNFQQGKPLPIGGGMVVSQNPKLTFSDANRESVPPNILSLVGYMAFSHPEMYGLYRNGGDKLATVLTGDERPSTHPESKEAVTYAPPFKTISNFQGSVGSLILDRLSKHRTARAKSARWYTNKLADISGIELLSPIEGVSNHSYVRYPLLVDSQTHRESIHESLEQIGIQSSMLYDWPPIESSAHPGGATLQNHLLTLPTHPYVTENDRRRICSSITQASE